MNLNAGFMRIAEMWHMDGRPILKVLHLALKHWQSLQNTLQTVAMIVQLAIKIYVNTNVKSAKKHYLHG